MKVKKLIGRLVAIVAMGISCAHAAPVVNPYAAGLDPSAYSSNSYAGAAQSVFNGGYWNAGGHGTFWLQADMGMSRTLSEVKLVLDVMPANYSASYFVYLSDTAIQGSYASLTSVASFQGYAVQNLLLDLTFAPTTGRYLEIVANGGASWTALGLGERTTWTETAAQGGNVSEPETFALLMASLGVMGAITRRRKAKVTA
jgi:hypothetical protein